METGVAGAKAALASRGRWAAFLVTLVLLALPGLAFAHPERPSYWPDPAPDRSVSPPAGGKVPTARSLASAVTGNGPGDVNVVCKGTGERVARRSRAVAAARPRPTASACVPASRRSALPSSEADELLRINQRAGQAVRLPLGAAGGPRLRQQRPGRDHARPLHGAGVAQAPHQRPALQPEPAPEGRQRRPDPELRVSGDLSERPEPDLRAGPRVVGRPARAPARQPPGDPGAGAGRVRALQLPDRGLGPQARGRDPRRRQGLRDPSSPARSRGRRLRSPDGYTKHVVLRADRADGFVGRNLLTRGGREYGIYTEEIDGYPARPREVLLERRLRPPLVHLRPRPDPNCEGFGSGDSVVYPGAAPETGSQADTSFYPDAPRYNTVVKYATCTARRSATRARWATPCGSPTTSIYGNVTGHLQRHALGRRPPRLPGRQLQDRSQPASTRTTSISTSTNPPVEPLVAVPIGTGIIYAGMNDARVNDN